MKKHYFLSALLGLFLVIGSLHGVHAVSGSISGDSLCGGYGQPECNLNNFKDMMKKVLYTFVLVGGSALITFIAIRLVQSWFAYRNGNANAIKEAGTKALNGVIGFFIIFTIFAGLLYTGLSYLGTKPEFLQFLNLFSSLFVEHAYAADTTEQYLSNPLTSDNIFDLILAAMNLAMRFFVYPAIIVMWTWSAFQFIYAQGSPEGLKKAKSWIFWAVIITVVTFTLQGFLVALKSTALKIAPNNPAVTQPSSSTGGTTDFNKPLGYSCTNSVQCASGFCDPADDVCSTPTSPSAASNGGYKCDPQDPTCTP